MDKSSNNKIMFLFGTRPEGIKLVPVILEAKRRNADIVVCSTGQHKEMLDQVLDFFGVKVDYDLGLMKPNQTQQGLIARAIVTIDEVLEKEKPACVVVQGDTTTVMVGALAGFLRKVKVAHVEAGLRSWDKFSPYPEEMNRLLTGRLADLHFAPTDAGKENLNKEGITDKIWNVGNTVIDALFTTLETIDKRGDQPYKDKFQFLDFSRRIILVTCHRRESFGQKFEDICRALRHIAETNPDVQLVYPVHLNPNIKENAEKFLTGIDNLHLITPLDYPSLIWLMNHSHMVLTDSGGIQEEAPSLGKPVLVLREVTERQEGVDAGTAMLVGADYDAIVNTTQQFLDDEDVYNGMAKAVNPYGDGTSSKQIMDILEQEL